MVPFIPQMDILSKKPLTFAPKTDTLNMSVSKPIGANISHFKGEHNKMVFTDHSFKFFSLIQSHVRSSLAEAGTTIPFGYKQEVFFTAYDAMQKVWQKRQSQRRVAASLGISRATFKKWEKAFVDYGTVGLLRLPSFVKVDTRLEKLVVLVRSAYPHAATNSILTLAQALNIAPVSIELIGRIQRSYGYGQRQDQADVIFYHNLQKFPY